MKDTPSQSDSLKFWQNEMAYFCSNDFSVWQARASLKLSIDNILCIELKQSYCEILESVSAVLAKISWYFHQSLQGLAAAVPLLEIDNISLVCRYIIEICPVLMACTWKNRVLLAAFWDKISIFHLGQTEHCWAHGEVHSARRIAILLAAFDVALPSEREKPSWIDWTIEISPCTRWVLLGRPLHALRFARYNLFITF